MKSRSLFVSVFLVAAVIMGTHCGGGDKNGGGGGMTPTPTPQPTPTPSPTPLAVAQQAFATKVYPFYNHDRCVNCHDFNNRRMPGGPLAFHPAVTVSNGQTPANCTGCHSKGAPANIGFDGWVEVPDNALWVKNDDPEKLRKQSIALKGVLLYNHLVGEGANADEFVQWCFHNAPNDPPDTTVPGKVPAGGPHAGQIQPPELMDWPSFKLAVDEWICKESMVPGAQDLGKPAALDCSVF